MSVGIGSKNIIILEASQFHFWEYINGNQTFILDSHRPFICNADSLISNPDPNPDIIRIRIRKTALSSA
jgi:hypothetical protein